MIGQNDLRRQEVHQREPFEQGEILHQEGLYIGKVIGREGERTRALEEALNLGIHLNKEDVEVLVTGTRCDEVKKIIE